MAGYLYTAYGLKGAAFSILIFVPGAFIGTAALMLACREAFTFSSMLFSSLTPAAKPSAPWKDFRIYNKRYLFIFIFFIVAAFTDALMSSIFMRLFTF